ncbi:putative colanic acid biosynthesis UDP-glucose lipid carrier transferase [Orbus hercynius]|uniref:Putative colanic acid biosynthesis UDP-glucose lipid carrier transferase n=1 Tax=Orbus hercynius TaxID=593135 RepID=A0A495RBN1_9GAMM|nr:undecaprenyl-phosphate glucose phosphotransferase [Orbus hercynius]RKS84686.1 putative colanic acid biosynthesis UDP-glucose lipid carrier transferase [Orbus hercynius]
MIRNSVSRASMPSSALFQMIFDLVIIFTSSYIIHYVLNDGELMLYSPITFFVIICFLLSAIIRNFYYSQFPTNANKQFISLLKVWCLGFWSAVVLYEIISLFSEPLLFLCYWFISVCAVFYLYLQCFQYLGKRFFHKNVLNVAFIARQSEGRLLARNLKKMPWIKYNIVGFYDENYQSNSGIELKGDFQQLIKDAKAGLLDQIYIADSAERHHDIVSLVKDLADTTCSVMLLPDIFTFNLLRSRIYTINNLPVVSIYDTPFKGINALVKRLEDIVVASIILILISPVLLGIALAIKLTSKGPIIFKQDRYGIHGKIIKIWKFRSMKVMENDAQVQQATKNDPRFTPIGKFLRRTSLDELPQFFNVLLGDMSIVGPRPHAIVHNEQYRAIILGYMLRHKVKPGITGWAQINGYRGETDTLDKMEKRVEYDLEYIRNWSVSFDIRIIFLTILKGFISKTAY